MLTPTMSFAEAIDQVATAALTTLPTALHERLARAVALCETGGVWMAEDGVHGQVQSSDGEHFYSVNDVCTCPDAIYRGLEGRCQHALAVKLYRKAVQRM